MSSYLTSTGFMFQGILAGLILTLVTGWLGIRIARRYGLLDIPGTAPHKQHRQPTPLAGGIALMVSLIILVFGSGLWQVSDLAKIIIPTMIVFILGLWDDIRSLPARIKVVGQVVAAILLIAFGIYIQALQAPTFFFKGSGTLLIWLEYGLTILWVVGVTNAFNLVNSMDGIGTGLGAWAFGFFMLATYDSGQLQLSMFSAIMVGICLSLYFYNASPARLFMGDSGDQTLGYLLAAVAILYSPRSTYQSSSWFVPVLLVGVPIFDTTLVFFSRLRRRIPFYKGGTDHTYHRLVKLGLNPSRAVMIMHMVALVLECLAFIAVSQPPLQANLIFLTIIILGIVCLVLLDRPKMWKKP